MLNQEKAEDQATALAGKWEPLRRSLLTYFARRVRDAVEVEDLVQEVFLRVVQRNTSGEIDHFSGYVFQTARSVLMDRQRRRMARNAEDHVQFDAELHAGQEIDAGRHLEGKSDLRIATAALLQLPERTRTIFVLRRLEGLRHQEIASRLSISVSAVEKHMMRAVQHLAARFGEGA